MNQPGPQLSIVIPTFQRERQLAACLDALAATMDEDVRCEVIVVDDGSSAPPHAVVTAAAARLPIRLLCQPHRGPAAARNAGAAVAGGSCFAFLDDDCLPAHDWQTALVGRLASDPTAAVAGRTVNVRSPGLCAETSQYIVDALHRHHLRQDGTTSFGTSNNLALPAAAFHAVGGFDEGFTLAAGEDRDLCARLDEHGVRLAYAEDVVVYHDHDLSLGDFVRQQFHYGAGAYVHRRAAARRAGRALQLESPAFYLDLVTGRGQRPPVLRSAATSALVALAQAAVAAGFLWQWQRQSRGQRGAGRPA